MNLSKSEKPTYERARELYEDIHNNEKEIQTLQDQVAELKIKVAEAQQEGDLRENAAYIDNSNRLAAKNTQLSRAATRRARATKGGDNIDVEFIESSISTTPIREGSLFCISKGGEKTWWLMVPPGLGTTRPLAEGLGVGFLDSSTQAGRALLGAEVGDTVPIVSMCPHQVEVLSIQDKTTNEGD